MGGWNVRPGTRPFGVSRPGAGLGDDGWGEETVRVLESGGREGVDVDGLGRGLP